MILEWFSRFLPKSIQSPQDATPSDCDSEARTAGVVNGLFHQATNFTIHGANMFDRPQIFQTIQNTVTTGTAALDRLLPYTCPDAAVDSSARHPPPRCHSGTRQRILGILNDWLANHLWNIFWLSGPAGTGKSAVAQTFADICLERGRLGAAYFFFRSSGRSDPQTLIPSLAYQLAVNVPDYGHLLACAIARDPSIFHKTPHVQLRRLIVEPITHLQLQGHEINQSPLLIILDGLDECNGIEAQCEIVEMIGEVVRLKKDLPLLWLIASRPEPHLQYIFSRADFSIDCSKETLVIDAETRDDVDRYLRDSFNDIRTRFPLVTDIAWPSEAHSRRVEDIASGLFALASTIIRYISESDITYSNPTGRLAEFLAFMSNADHVSTTNPLQTLDLLYSQILSQIPENIYPMTKQILAIYDVISVNHLPIQFCCNLLCMDKNEFYNALDKIHSLFDIPLPDKASKMDLRMHHTSFSDYLRSPFRSGRFHTSTHFRFIYCLQICLFWYKTILKDPRYISDDSFSMITNTTALPGLKWASSDDGSDVAISRCIRAAICDTTWFFFSGLTCDDEEEFLDQLEDFDFRYMLLCKDDRGDFSKFVVWLLSLGPRNTLSRTKPQGELDQTLLDKVVHNVARRMEPAVFPMVKTKDSKSSYRYVFIGRGTRTCLFWFNEMRILSGRCRLSCKVLPKSKYTSSDCIIHVPEDL